MDPNVQKVRIRLKIQQLKIQSEQGEPESKFTQSERVNAQNEARPNAMIIKTTSFTFAYIIDIETADLSETLQITYLLIKFHLYLITIDNNFRTETHGQELNSFNAHCHHIIIGVE